MDARTGRRQKRISRMQEKRAARDVGGQTQANSGATRLGGGGDVRVAGDTRIECKYTESCSFTLRLGELLKLRKEAIGALEQPVFQFQFRSIHGGAYATYAVIPATVVMGYAPDKLTTSRQMNFHETDLNQFFWVDKNPTMHIAFFEKKTQKVWHFDLMMWDTYLKTREEANA